MSVRALALTLSRCEMFERAFRIQMNTLARRFSDFGRALRGALRMLWNYPGMPLETSVSIGVQAIVLCCSCNENAGAFCQLIGSPL